MRPDPCQTRLGVAIVGAREGAGWTSIPAGCSPPWRPSSLETTDVARARATCACGLLDGLVVALAGTTTLSRLEGIGDGPLHD